MQISTHNRSILAMLTELANSGLDGESLTGPADVIALGERYGFTPPLLAEQADVRALHTLRSRLRTALVPEEPPGVPAGAAGTADPAVPAALTDQPPSTRSAHSAELHAPTRPSEPHSAPDPEDPEDRERQAAELVNALYRETRTLPELQKHDGWGWHVHAVPNEAALSVRIASDLAVALTDLLVDGELSRLGVCAAVDCDGLFTDLSRNRSKRFCDRGNCANRTHVAAYRARQPG